MRDLLVQMELARKACQGSEVRRPKNVLDKDVVNFPRHHHFGVKDFLKLVKTCYGKTPTPTTLWGLRGPKMQALALLRFGARATPPTFWNLWG